MFRTQGDSRRNHKSLAHFEVETVAKVLVVFSQRIAAFRPCRLDVSYCGCGGDQSAKKQEVFLIELLMAKYWRHFDLRYLRKILAPRSYG